MVLQVTAEQAEKQLPELITAAINGETVVITQGGQQGVQLVPVSQTRSQRQPGSAKGLIWMADDFDEPLADFNEYMV